jgi:hypothetical protein
MIGVDIVAQEFFQRRILTVLVFLSFFFSFIDEVQLGRVLIMKAR